MAQINKDKKVYYYQNDLIGLPQELSSVNGTIVWSAGYDAFGKDTVDEKSYVTNPLRFQGQYYDEELGLSCNRFRYFDPEICAFVSQDPLGLAPSSNLYKYAPNTWGWVDPFGLSCDPGLDDFAKRLEDAGIPVRNKNISIAGEDGRIHGEIDIVTDNALIQFKNGASSANAVIEQVTEKTEPFVTRPVIAFINDTGKAGSRTVKGAGDKILVTNDFDTLVSVIK